MPTPERLDFRVVFNAASNGMALTSAASGRVLDVNDAWVRASGIPREDAVGRTGSELGVWCDEHDRTTCFETLEQHGRLDDVEVLLMFRGRPVPHVVSAGFVDMGGERHVLWEFRDISKRRRDEAMLIESERRFREIFDSVSDAIFIHDAHTGATVDVNRRMVEMYGFTREEVLAGKQWEHRGVSPYSVDEALDMLRRAREEGPQVFEWPARRKDGSEFWVEVRLRRARIGPHDRIIGLVSDITERKRLEAQLREAQKLEALGTLAGGIAHDFNNVLATILGNVKLAREDATDPRDVQSCLDEIARAGQRARNLVKQILAFGRQQEVRRTVTSLSLIVVEAARFIRATLPAMVDLRIDCQPNAPPVLADAPQIEQVLINLCANALQAIDDCVRPGAIELRLEGHLETEARGGLAAGHYALLSVRDNGCGMADTTRVFEPFFTTRPVGGGSGLGLAVVHGILQSHEAVVELESSPGRGTTVRMYFPAASVEQPGEITPRPERITLDGRGARILYVDDEQAIIYLMTRLLQRRGCHVHGFTDAEEAVDAFRSDPSAFDLVVTDYRMPKLTGLDVARAVKTVRPEVPVLLASGFVTDDLRDKAPAFGVQEVVNKPDTADELCEVLARYLNAP